METFHIPIEGIWSGVQTRVWTPHMKVLSDVISGLGTLQIEMCSNVLQVWGHPIISQKRN